MKARLVLIMGVALLLTAVVGFLASAVALATAQEEPEIQTPAGVTLTAPEDAPQVAERKRQAEVVLLGSLLCGGLGLLCVFVSAWLRKSLRSATPSPEEEAGKTSRGSQSDEIGHPRDAPDQDSERTS